MHYTWEDSVEARCLGLQNNEQRCWLACCNLHKFVLCFVEACLCFIVLVHLSCVTYVPCATITWRGEGGGAMARYAMQWFV